MKYRELLKDLSWNVDFEEAKERLHVMEDDEDDFREIYDKVVSLIKPVYYIGREMVLSNDGNTLKIGNQCFHSRVICVNLETCKEVYPYVGTSGREAYEYAISLKDPLMNYWADAICEMALKSAARSFFEYAKKELHSDSISSLNPGSVIDWPISEQRPLFELLGNVMENTGIYLEPTFLMRPVKSGSGILYVSEKHFESCSLCAKENCPNRREPFDAEKFQREYQ